MPRNWSAKQTRNPLFHFQKNKFINRQEREVRVVFEPADGEDTTVGDLRDAEAAGVGLVGRVEAVVFRQNRAHRRLQSEAVWLSHYAGDPLMERRHGTRYTVARERDGLLERRLAAQIEREIGRRTAAEPEAAAMITQPRP